MVVQPPMDRPYRATDPSTPPPSLQTTWQYAVADGCPWSSSVACNAFEKSAAAMEALYSALPSDTLLDALAAAELHRHWLRTRLGGCPCRRSVKSPHPISRLHFRSVPDMRAIFARGFEAAEPFLNLWQLRDSTKFNFKTIYGGAKPRL